MRPTPDTDTPPLTPPESPPAAVVLHGHFYQPPREDPRTDRIRDEASAAPHANWNERITEECYAPLARAGVFDWVSFDLGPTLARWLRSEVPEVHDAFVAGDHSSRDRLGHGNAIAQPYHHIILPLASAQEKRAEIRWGLSDFERRFGRPAEGMWLPETAVDRETLAALAREGVAFTVVAPHQVEHPPAGGVGRVSLDSRRSIAVFTYDGDLSHGVAFGALLEGSDRWFDRIGELAREGAELVALATDGETFGHHHTGADRALADVIDRLRDAEGPTIENFASVLASRSTIPEVELVEPSSWSCSHGVERWRSACGCKMAPERPSQQEWRRPLRAALVELARSLDRRLDALGPDALRDPETALDSLVDGLGGSDALRAYASRHAASAGTVETAHALLEIARDRAAMFTSCAWFFDDVAGIEPAQVLSYAAHAIDRLRELEPTTADDIEREFESRLTEAPANDPEFPTAADVYRAQTSDTKSRTPSSAGPVA